MKEFYKNKKVLITGHTGFKGTWLSKMLILMGADVVGYALKPASKPNLFDILHLSKQMKSVEGDIRDLNHLKQVFEAEQPEIVFHLAAQPIVLESYQNPVYTYETNVIGTVNVLECIRLVPSVKSVVNVTTDKVYLNNEWEWGYRENERLCGFDPYSNSKSCSELATYSYKHSFFSNRDIAISTARAGNVIGGGDFSPNRIIPDCITAAQNNRSIELRNPNSVRPYQHVLDPLHCYLMIAQEQYLNPAKEGEYNIGPDEKDCISTGTLATIFTEKWGVGISWHAIENNGPHEANFLKLDCSKLKRKFHWQAIWDVEKAVEECVIWAKAYLQGEDMNKIMESQIKNFSDNKAFTYKLEKSKRK